MQGYFDTPHIQIARSLIFLAEALRRCGQLNEAEECARDAVDQLATHRGWPERDRVNAHWFLARTLDDAGRADEAIESLRDFVEDVRVRGQAETRIRSLQMLAWILLKCDDASAPEVEILMRECLQVCESELTPNHPFSWLRDEATSLLGEALTAQGRFLEAEQTLRDALDGLSRATTIPLPARLDYDYRGEAVRRIARLHSLWRGSEPCHDQAEKATRWRVRPSASTHAPTDAATNRSAERE